MDSDISCLQNALKIHTKRLAQGVDQVEKLRTGLAPHVGRLPGNFIPGRVPFMDLSTMPRLVILLKPEHCTSSRHLESRSP